MTHKGSVTQHNNVQEWVGWTKGWCMGGGGAHCFCMLCQCWRDDWGRRGTPPTVANDSLWHKQHAHSADGEEIGKGLAHTTHPTGFTVQYIATANPEIDADKAEAISDIPSNGLHYTEHEHAYRF